MSLIKKIENFTCDLCDRKFSKKLSLKKHTIKRHTGNNKIQRKVFIGSRLECSTVANEYCCPCCSYKGQSKSELDNHLLNKCFNYGEYIGGIKKVNGEKIVINCHWCSYKAKSKKRYKNHIKKHGQFKELHVFSCPQCSYTTCRRSLIRSHLLTHTKVKNYKCDQCNYSAIRSDYLKKHLVTHTKDHRPYKCNFCGYSAVRNDYLKKHILKHSQYPSVKCPDCDYRCTNEDDLNEHAKNHKQATIFKCTTCDFESHEKNIIKEHVTTHSEFSAFVCHHISLNYKCEKCKLTLNSNDDVISHQCTMENLDEISCQHCNYKTVHKQNFTIHALTHCSTNNSSVIEYTQLAECNGNINLNETESITLMSNCTIVELSDNITFLTDSKLTGDDLVISAYPIEDLNMSKEDIPELLTDQQSLILNIDY